MRTQSCSEHGHPEFEIADPDLPGEALAELMAWLEIEVTQGRVFGPGELVDIGGSVLRVVQGDPHLAFEEPVPGSLPIRWRPGVRAALERRVLQEALVTEVDPDLPPDLGFARHQVYVCPHARPGDVAYVRAVDAEHGESGWIVRCTAPDAQHEGHALSGLSYYEASLRWPVGRFRKTGLSTALMCSVPC